MDPRAVLRPVGRQPARIYWVRRLLLLVLLAVLVVALAKACGGSGSGGGTGGRPTPTPTVSSPSARPAPQHAAACRRGGLQVTASTDSPTYAAGALPHLTAIVKNVSPAACRFTTSPQQRTWTIRSGSDRVWSSTDCTVSGIVGHSRLRPGGTIVYSLVWNRHRSAQGCPASTPQAQPGTYLLDVTVNGVAAPTVVFHVTG